MSKEIQQSERLAVVEYCLQSYFDTHFLSVMHSVKDFIGQKQAEEIGEYALSPADCWAASPPEPRPCPTIPCSTCG